MKHPAWSTIIVASFGIILALIAGFGPALMPDISNNLFSGRRFNAAPSPTIQMDRPKDTFAKFAGRLAVGGSIGVLIGFAAHKGIIRKFEEDFTIR